MLTLNEAIAGKGLRTLPFKHACGRLSKLETSDPVINTQAVGTRRLCLLHSKSILTALSDAYGLMIGAGRVIE